MISLRSLELRGTSAAARLAVYTIACLSLLAMTGCGPSQRLSTEYGRTEFPLGDLSVNGLGVFAEMFKSAGHNTAATSSLRPQVAKDADVIVWAPRDLEAPSPDAIDWLENWLNDSPDRTLIYIHRDYDAAPAYWREVGPKIPANLRPVTQPQITEAKNNFTSLRTALPATATTDFHWFTASGVYNPRNVTTLVGDPKWTAAIDPTQLEIDLIGDVTPSSAGQTVLASGQGDPLIIEDQRTNGNILVLANGSFVLNYPLINKENRKLAGKIVDSVGDDKYVVFLQAGSSPPVLEEDPVQRIPSPFTFLWIAPINYVLLHLILFGLILCFARYPIFGIPRNDDPDNLSDFGEHINALGALLARTGKQGYAIERLQAYRKLVRGDHATTRNLAYAKEHPEQGNSPTDE